MIQETLAIIKPDGVTRGLIGEVIRRIESHGLKVKAMKMAHLSKKEARRVLRSSQGEAFFREPYQLHVGRAGGVMILSGENAIQVWRDLMGATDPAKSAPGTIRREFGLSIERNTTHGSDAPETAAFENLLLLQWNGACN